MANAMPADQQAELSLSDLDAESCTELPARTLLRRHRRMRHHTAGAFASFGSAANSNQTTQVNFNPQIVVNNGGSGGVHVSSNNVNSNTTNQTAIPINFSI